MVELPRYKVFVAKFSNETHRDLVTRMISRANGQIAATKDYAGLMEKVETHRDDLAGVIYELRNEGEVIPGEESVSNPETVVASLRRFVGESLPIVATYYPTEQEGLEQLFSDAGADVVLAHPFTRTEFYGAIDEALKKQD
jgi:hypothetical protein